MNRVEAFSDGVIAVVITIMVLELKVPADPSLASLQKVAPHVVAYLYSFLTVGIMWANHHHLLKGARRPDSTLLWTNNNLLFWMSLIPFVTAYIAAHPLQPVPVALYGGVSMMMGFGFVLLRYAILSQHHAHLKDASHLQQKLQWKTFSSAAAYLVAAAMAFVNIWVSYAIYVAIPAMYFIPDPSIATTGEQQPPQY